jgi:protein involved in polysaccharide export with SLBB domain
MISVNLMELIEKGSDIDLKREDKITIASKMEMREEFNITINGNVLKPGVYPYASKMKIEDLIILAGGLKEAASLSNIQVAQRSFEVDKSNSNSDKSSSSTNLATTTETPKRTITISETREVELNQNFESVLSIKNIILCF